MELEDLGLLSHFAFSKNVLKSDLGLVGKCDSTESCHILVFLGLTSLSIHEHIHKCFQVRI